MQIELINQINENFSPIEQILFNRGIQKEQMKHYLYPSEYDINDYRLFGQDKMSAAVRSLITSIAADGTCLVIVDCDCDGYTSAAILINYLYELYPTWVLNKVKWFMHDSKQHGLSDCINYAIQKQFNLVICPDASSNDYEEHHLLSEHGIKCIVLDHHYADKIDQQAIIINNQLSDYPNKDLSGAGIVYQFCRYIDNLLQVNNADHYLDLVALGLR